MSEHALASVDAAVEPFDATLTDAPDARPGEPVEGPEAVEGPQPVAGPARAEARPAFDGWTDGRPAHDTPPEQQPCPTCGERFPTDYRICPRDGSPLAGAGAADDPLVGTVLAGTYRIVRPLARGGMGRLYEAEHLRLERRFAVKVIHEQYARNPDAVKRFEREARAAGRIRSDHVVDVVDVLRTADGRPAIVAELLDGEDLQRRLDREGRPPLGEAVALALQLCRGLAAAHAHGVVHRDLKPSNIFLSAGVDGRVTVKLLDFGVAKLAGAEEITRTGAVVGTPSYMPPEQARGSLRVDERADVYSVGAVLYHLVCGRAPYVAGDATATLGRLLQDEPERPRKLDPAIPETVEAVVQRAMARDLGERIRNIAELERQLSAVASELPTESVSGAGAWSDDPAMHHEGGTLVLPAGSVAAASELAQRARRARPLAIAGTAALGLAAALSTAAVLSVSVRLLGHGPPTLGERILVALAALAAATLGSAAVVVALRPRWRSAVAVEPVVRRLGQALLAGATAFGGFELIARGLAALGVMTDPTARGAALRILAAAAVASTVCLLGALRKRH